MYAAAATPGGYGGPDGPAPTPGGGGYGGAPAAGAANYQHWVDVEVALGGGERGAVRGVDAGTASVAVGRKEGDRWVYPPDAPLRPVPVGDMALVAADRKEAIRIVRGELAGQYGELVGTDGGDGIIKMGADIKIINMTDIGRLATQPGGAAPPPPPA